MAWRIIWIQSGLCLAFWCFDTFCICAIFWSKSPSFYEVRPRVIMETLHHQSFVVHFTCMVMNWSYQLEGFEPATTKSPHKIISNWKNIIMTILHQFHWNGYYISPLSEKVSPSVRRAVQKWHLLLDRSTDQVETSSCVRYSSTNVHNTLRISIQFHLFPPGGDMWKHIFDHYSISTCSKATTFCVLVHL
jgi:hypothetical protein